MTLVFLGSVWAVTTCWSLLSRKTPALSVGGRGSPATASTAASPCRTCRPVRCSFAASLSTSRSPSGVSCHSRLQPDVHHPCGSDQHQHQGDARHTQLPRWVLGGTRFRPPTLTNLCACPAIKNLRGQYYLNGHWVIEFSRATPIAGTTLYYQRGAEGDNVPERITGRGPTTEPLVVEVGGTAPRLPGQRRGLGPCNS